MLKVTGRSSLTDTFFQCLLRVNTLHRGAHGGDTQAPVLTHKRPPHPSREPNKYPHEPAGAIQAARCPLGVAQLH